MYNQKSTCIENNGEWVEFSNYLEESNHLTKAACIAANRTDAPLFWGIPYRSHDIDKVGKVLKEKCLVALDRPHCELSPWSRDNHLGNGRGGVPLNYTWVLPHFPSKKNQRCVFRLRFAVVFPVNFPTYTDRNA